MGKHVAPANWSTIDRERAAFEAANWVLNPDDFVTPTVPALWPDTGVI